MKTRTYPATLLRVIDGDTLKLMVDVGFSGFSAQVLRLLGVNTPEGSDGDAATAFVSKWCALHPEMTVVTVQVKSRIGPARDKQGKWGRYLATVSDTHTGEILNEALLEAGLAVPYDGGKR